jgi:hypothetical protein
MKFQYYNPMEDFNMKKILSIIFSALLILGIGTNTFAGEKIDDKERQKAIQLVNKSNDKIRKEIEKGVIKAEKLQADYNANVDNLRNKDEAFESKIAVHRIQDVGNIEEVNEVFSKIEEELSNIAKTGDISDEIVIANGQMPLIVSKLQLDCKQILGATDFNGICISENEEKPQSSDNTDLTNKYISELEEIITTVYNETLKISNETIIKVRELGYNAECSWVEVEFGHLKVWIDPIRIVGI